MLKSLHSLMDSAQAYKFSQMLGYPTIQRYRSFVRKYIRQDVRGRLLEIGCGVGSSRPLFCGEYTGIDINPKYIEMARSRYSGHFYVMDAANMSFADGAFDDAVSIATAHHLSDAELAVMIGKAVEVATRVHIIDPILPLSAKSFLKETWFRMDRGGHVRTFDQLRNVVAGCASVECQDVVTGPLHDVCYIQASRQESH